MATVELTADTFQEAVTKDDSIVLVDIWASWCGPCRQFAPIFDKASEEHDDITFAKVNTEKEQELAGALGVQAIPTLMAFRDGIMVFNQAGALPASSLTELIDGVKNLDMEEVRAEVEKAQQEQSN